MSDDQPKIPNSESTDSLSGDLENEPLELQPPVEVPQRPADNLHLIRAHEASANLPVERFRFHIADVMTVVTGISIAFAGGTWIRSEIFALILGLLVLVGIAVTSFHPLESRRQSVLWLTLILSYISSTIAAFVRSN